MDYSSSQIIESVISTAKEEAIRLNHNYIAPQHLLLALIKESDGTVTNILDDLEVNHQELKSTLENAVENSSISINPFQPILIRQSEKVLKISLLESKLLKSIDIEEIHLFLSILREENSIAAQILSRFDVDYDKVRARLKEK